MARLVRWRAWPGGLLALVLLAGAGACADGSPTAGADNSGPTATESRAGGEATGMSPAPSATTNRPAESDRPGPQPSQPAGTTSPAPPNPAAEPTGDQSPEPPQYIAEAHWEDTAEGPTLVVTPTDAARQALGSHQAGVDGWEQLISAYPDPRLDQAQTRLRHQYICHQQFATIKEPDKPTWDLEMDRPDVGYAATVRASCNPDQSPQ